MTLKILQLNMWAGTHFPVIKAFLERNDFDILCFQEVAGPYVIHGNVHSTIDCFVELNKILDSTHNGQLAISQYSASNPTTGYFGNALFYKKEFSLLQKNILWLNKRSTPFPIDAKTFEEVGRNVLHLTLSKEGRTFEILTGHLAWATTKAEQPHQTKQNLTLISYIKALPKPWIITGDFNLAPTQPTILSLEQYGQNLTKKFGVKNTIDATFHKRWNELAPGEAIDYIFISPNVQVDSFRVLDNVHMSDHYGLTATLSF